MAAELQEANDAVQDREVAEYFKDPSSSMEQQLDTLTGLTDNVRPHALNLLRALVSRHRLHLLPAVVREFESLNRQARGIEEAYVTVARALTEEEIKGVGERLSTMTGKPSRSIPGWIHPSWVELWFASEIGSTMPALSGVWSVCARPLPCSLLGRS
jgi:ATP synthase F1 delta subunit